VTGDIKLSGAGSGLIFPDGTKQTTAGGGGAQMTGTSIVSAINDPTTTGTINDNRLSSNVARLNSANSFTGKQTVTGDLSATGIVTASNLVIDNGTLSANNVAHRVGIGTVSPGTELDVRGTVAAHSVAAGSINFADGSVQFSAGPKMYTTSQTSADIEINPAGACCYTPILQLNFPLSSTNVAYLLTATVQFENTANAFLSNNSRFVTCYMGNEAWSFRLGGSGSVTDRLPMTVHTVWIYSNGNPPILYCAAIDGGTDRSYVFARTRRLTATRVEILATQ